MVRSVFTDFRFYTDMYQEGGLHTVLKVNSSHFFSANMLTAESSPYATFNNEESTWEEFTEYLYDTKEGFAGLVVKKSGEREVVVAAGRSTSTAIFSLETQILRSGRELELLGDHLRIIEFLSTFHRSFREFFEIVHEFFWWTMPFVLSSKLHRWQIFILGPAFPDIGTDDVRGGASVQYRNSFLAIGGIADNVRRNEIWMYDPDKEQWDTLNFTLKVARNYHAAFLVPDDFWDCSWPYSLIIYSIVADIKYRALISAVFLFINKSLKWMTYLEIWEKIRAT